MYVLCSCLSYEAEAVLSMLIPTARTAVPQDAIAVVTDRSLDPEGSLGPAGWLERLYM